MGACCQAVQDLFFARRSRRLHFFGKYLLASACVLCVIVIMLWHIPAFRPWNPIYAMTTVSVHALLPLRSARLCHMRPFARARPCSARKCKHQLDHAFPSRIFAPPMANRYEDLNSLMNIVIWRSLQVAVVLSEKVDTTLSKGILRVGGTVVGGSLGEPCFSLPASKLCPSWSRGRAPLLHPSLGRLVMLSPSLPGASPSRDQHLAALHPL